MECNDELQKEVAKLVTSMVPMAATPIKDLIGLVKSGPVEMIGELILGFVKTHIKDSARIVFNAPGLIIRQYTRLPGLGSLKDAFDAAQAPE